eukprot:1899486-Amphidinium_carterae.1
MVLSKIRPAAYQKREENAGGEKSVISRQKPNKHKTCNKQEASHSAEGVVFGDWCYSFGPCGFWLQGDDAKVMLVLVAVNVLFAIMADAVFRAKYAKSKTAEEAYLHEDEPLEDSFRTLRDWIRRMLLRYVPPAFYMKVSAVQWACSMGSNVAANASVPVSMANMALLKSRRMR